MDKLRAVLSGSDNVSTDERQGFAAQMMDSTTLNMGTRIKWFLLFFGIGFTLSILGVALLMIPVKGLVLFALFYTLGNICSVGSTLFLMGPWKQLKRMFDEKRILATVFMFAFMVLTLMAALVWKKGLLSLLCCLFQFLAFTWYAISYIPYAHDAVTKAVTSIV